MQANDDVRKFSTGAVRSKDADGVRYDLISPIALEEIAKTYHEGAERYGDHNWLKGMSVSDLLNHAIRHIYLFLSGDRSEPHLPHAAWGLMAAIHSYKMWPHLNGKLLAEGCKPPSEGVRLAEGTFVDSKEWRESSLESAWHDFVDKVFDGKEPNLDPSPIPHLTGIPILDDFRAGKGPAPVLYLSGPMSGITDYNFPAFNRAADALRGLGYPVLNPADFGVDPSISWAKCLERDLAVIAHAQILVQLPDWEYSRGASLEYSVAVGLGKGIVDLSDIADIADIR